MTDLLNLVIAQKIIKTTTETLPFPDGGIVPTPSEEKPQQYEAFFMGKRAIS